MGRNFFDRGREAGRDGREVGDEGAGSGDRGGGKRGSSTPLSTPIDMLKRLFYKELTEIKAQNTI